MPGFPQREPRDQTADTDQPREDAVGHGAEAAHAEAAVPGLLLERLQVGDDVALLLGCEVAVAEAGHVLRAGQQGLVDVLGLHAVESRGIAAARHGATRSLEVVAGGAVGQEDLATTDDRRLLGVVVETLDRVVGLVGDGGAGAQRGDVRRELGGLLLRVGDRLAGSLGAGLGHRHPAGADLEVDRRGADADERGAEVVAVKRADALAVEAVAARAAHEEQLAALLDLDGQGVGVLRLGGGQRGVETTGGHQADQQQDESGQRAATVTGEATGGAVHEAHWGSLGSGCSDSGVT